VFLSFCHLSKDRRRPAFARLRRGEHPCHYNLLLISNHAS
jgi:hypothetical protein